MGTKRIMYLTRQAHHQMVKLGLIYSDILCLPPTFKISLSIATTYVHRSVR